MKEKFNEALKQTEKQVKRGKELGDLFAPVAAVVIIGLIIVFFVL